jgi:hypothetical protein
MSERAVDRGGVDSPWIAEDLVRWATTTAVALAVIAVAGIAAHGQKLFHNQYVWGDLAVAGALVGFYANVIWLLRGRRSVGERMQTLLGDAPPSQVRTQAGPRAGEGHAVSLELVAPNGAKLFHRPECLLAVGREAFSASRSAHEAAGRAPCGVCRP